MPRSRSVAPGLKSTTSSDRRRDGPTSPSTMKRMMPFIGVELNVVSYREKLVSILGGAISIGLLVWICREVIDPAGAVYVIASMAASAVLVFAVPHGPLSQPWPVLAGHGLSAAIGVLCARLLGHGWLAAGVAVGVSIGAMHQLRCIHPPGGATALTAVIGGEAIHRMGFSFVLWPVLTNAAILLGVALVFNWPFVWRRYPVGFARNRGVQRPVAPGEGDAHADIVKALKTIDSFIDVHEADLMDLARMIAREREVRVSAARKPGPRIG
ncbi:MAG: hypothetical protein RLZ45_2621 [Verrucomicrobiota bacterium]